MHHMDTSVLCSQIVYVSLCFLNESQGSHMNHMDTFLFHAQIVYVYLCLLFNSQGSHRHHIDTSSLHAQIDYASLGGLFELKCGHLNHIDTSSLNAHIVYVSSGFLYQMQINHIYRRKVVTCITWICPPFMHKFHMCLESTFLSYLISTVLRVMFGHVMYIITLLTTTNSILT